VVVKTIDAMFAVVLLSIAMVGSAYTIADTLAAAANHCCPAQPVSK
jgi:hypothetical protein